jgi:hypothetical protein
VIAMVRNDAPWLADLVGGLTPLDAADVHACGGYALRHGANWGSPFPFAALFELLSKPTKSPAQAHRTYELSFENGEPIFTLSEISRIMEDAFEEIFGSGEIE